MRKTILPLIIVLLVAVLSGCSNNQNTANQNTVGQNTPELVFGGETVPSLSKIMEEQNIKYDYIRQDKTVGKLAVPSILDYFETPTKSPVEIIEITYNNVEDVYGAIDAYGMVLNKTYGFQVTFLPTEYPNYGQGYRFCELIKASSDKEDEILYVSAIYSKTDKVIKLRFGTIGTNLSTELKTNGIGPLNLENIRNEQ